jgi:acetoin utilization protein AcuC
VDCLPDGRTTNFGTQLRNLEAEYAALQYGLAPGQIRRGLGLFAEAVTAFEKFVSGIGQDIFFVEPLYYHNAVAFEKHGFAYQQGRKLMERIEDGLAEDGDLLPLLNSSTPFRSPQAAKSIRLRSWAIHDNLLGEPFTNVTMYKWVGKMANTNTCQNCPW